MKTVKACFGRDLIDCLVMVSNRLDPEKAGGDQLRDAIDGLKAALPSSLPLGMYECPAPYRRLLTDAEVQYLCDDPQFVFLKDVSCDLDTVRHRMRLAKNSALAISNANAAIAHQALTLGAGGFCGVFNNFHPDLYRWLQDEGPDHRELADELAVFLALAALSEPMGYPKLAKLHHQRLGTFKSDYSRAVSGDILAILLGAGSRARQDFTGHRDVAPTDCRDGLAGPASAHIASSVWTSPLVICSSRRRAAASLSRARAASKISLCSCAASSPR